MGKANEPVKVDGALRMAGELAAQLTTSKVREEKKIEELMMMMCCVNKDGVDGEGKGSANQLFLLEAVQKLFVWHETSLNCVVVAIALSVVIASRSRIQTTTLSSSGNNCFWYGISSLRRLVLLGHTRTSSQTFPGERRGEIPL